MLVYIDTSAWIATTVKKDINYKMASAYYLELLKKDVALITSNYVLSETYTRLRYDVSHIKAVEFHKIIMEAVKQDRLSIYWVDESVSLEAWQIFEKYTDQYFSIVDCTSFVIGKKLCVDEIFAFDEDFAIMKFIVKPFKINK